MVTLQYVKLNVPTDHHCSKGLCATFQYSAAMSPIDLQSSRDVYWINRKVNAKARQVARYSENTPDMPTTDRAGKSLDRPTTQSLWQKYSKNKCAGLGLLHLSTNACVLGPKSRERRAPASLVTINHGPSEALDHSPA